VKLQFSGAPEVTAPKHIVWQRLVDPCFVAGSAPGVESIAVIEPRHFWVISGFGPRAMKARITLEGELFDLVPGVSAKMRPPGNAARHAHRGAFQQLRCMMPAWGRSVFAGLPGVN
jgi:carbon monoxide dehydrogenase subunit G